MERLKNMKQNRDRRTDMLTGLHRYAVILLLMISALLSSGCIKKKSVAEPDEIVSSRAYRGHASDADINNFVRTYPKTVGTRLDDCQTCHAGGTVMDDEMEAVTANPCDFCHFIQHPPDAWTGLPETIEETLNPYGKAYHAEGRDGHALIAIGDLDSDEDGFANREEIEELKYPGNASSYPGLELCPMITVTLDQLKTMPQHTQFVLANATKQQFDHYATYKGVKIKDILDELNVDLTDATGVDIMAPDGFAKSFTVDQITRPFPDHAFYPGFGVEDLGAECAFVEYPDQTYGLAWGDRIAATLDQEFWHIMAYEREGQPLEQAYLDPATGRINGEGPFRNIIPPGAEDEKNNRPDRGKNQEASGCTLPEWNFNSHADHNAGSMVKAAVIIRINPVPAGYEEFDIINGGWAMVDGEFLLIYGRGVTSD